jgi:putative nucleotidyltransferase with HDIG domain
MSSAAFKFLTSFSQSLSTMLLYPREHPTWSQALNSSYDLLQELQQENPKPVFSFLGGDVIYGHVPLPELRDWPWATKLADVGVQRLEFQSSVPQEEYTALMEDVLARIMQSQTYAVDAKAGGAIRRPSIRFGSVVVRSEAEGMDEAEIMRRIAADNIPYNLGDEVNAVKWMQQEASANSKVPIAEADTVVRSLSVAMRGSSAMIIPLLRLKASDPYSAIHSINVSVLSMALAEFVGLSPGDVHSLGMAALLHDLGMARVPQELLYKVGELTPEEKATIERHPVDGARIIMASSKRQDVAALVAYEHHMRPDGTGYPLRTHPSAPQYASGLVRVCSVYNALRITRPHRPPLPAATALLFLEDRAGTEFDKELAMTFTNMMRRLEPHIAEVDRDTNLFTPQGGTPAVIPDDVLHH